MLSHQVNVLYNYKEKVVNKDMHIINKEIYVKNVTTQIKS